MIDAENDSRSTRGEARTCANCGASRQEGRICERCGALLPVEDRSEARREGEQHAAVRVRLQTRLALLDGLQSASATVREARVALGQALGHAGRHVEADEEFARALSDEGSRPSSANILLLRSHIALLADRATDADRYLLEAVAEDPQSCVSVIADLIPFVDSAFADAHGDWTVREWLPKLSPATLTPSTWTEVNVLAATTEFCRGRFAEGLALVDVAVGAAPERCREILPPVLDGELMQVETPARYGKAQTMLAVASAWRAIGRDDRALEAANEALSAEFTGDDYPEAIAYRLRAELRLATSDRAGAASDFFEAGCRLGWRAEFEEATRLLAKSAELNPDRRLTYWYWADDLRIHASGRPDELELLEEALRIWQLGANTGPIPADEAWAYLARAAVFEAQSDLDPEHGANCIWQAILDSESALAVNPSLLNGWTTVSRLFRDVGMHSVSAHALARGLELAGAEIEPHEEPVLSEKVAATWAHDPDALEEIAEQYRETFGSARGWVDLVVGIARVRAADLANGLAILERSVAADEADTERRFQLARAHFLAGEIEQGRADCERLLLQMGDAPLRILDTWKRAWMACVTDQLDEARQLADGMERRLQTSGQHRADVEWLWLLIRLAAGDGATAEDRLVRLLDAQLPVGELIDAGQDVALVGSLYEGRKGVPDMARSLHARIREHRLNRRTPPGDATSAERDVRRTLEAADVTDVMRVGCTARLASLYCDLGELALATHTYAELEHVVPPFPPASEAFAGAVRRLLASAESSLRSGDVDDVVEQFAEVVAVAHERVDLASEHAEASQALSLLNLLTGGDPQRALPEALAAASVTAPDNPSASLASTWCSLIPDVAAFWRVDDSLAIVGSREADAMRGLLSSFLRTRLRTSAEEVTLVPFVTPIAFELGEDLIPPEAQTIWREWELFTRLIPELKDRITQKTGVKLEPGVRVRGNNSLAPCDYAIVLDDIRRAQGSTFPAARFVADPVDPSATILEGIPARDPGDGRTGRWVASGPAENEGVTGVSAIEYAVAHLEAEIGRNMSLFVVLDNVESLLSTWSADPELGRLVSATLPDKRARCRFAWVVRTLLDERVPLVEPRSIIDATRSVGIGNDLWEVVRVIRLSLRPLAMPADAVQVRIDPEIEARLAASNNDRSGIDTLTAWDLVANVRELLPPDGRGALVVVKASALRPLVENLVQRAFPDVLVFSDDELGAMP